jgi:2-polyprenyl-3-methyl-5-hydroxy-6-metoxy-1,4-benzoquinol methylase
MDRACPACGAVGARPAGGPPGWPVGRCRTCRSLHTLAVPAGVDEAAYEAYDAYYGDVALRVPAFVAGRLDEVVRTFEPFRQTGRTLDVGFGAGAMLDAMRRGGWAPTGVEVAPAALAAIADRHDVHLGPLEAIELEPASFDVVSMTEVLEHVADPAAALRAAAVVLRPGGLLLATTPNGAGLSVRLLGDRSSLVAPPEHLQLLTVRGVRALLSGAGYVGVSVRASGAHLHELRSGLRRRRRPDPGGGRSTERVEHAYALNHALRSSRPRRALLRVANAVLDRSRLGDGLTVRAQRLPN